MLADRRVKIVATIGPATANEKSLEELIRAGVNVIRLNFSHGTHEDHKKVIDLARSISARLATPVALLQDLQGPKVRTGKMVGGALELKEGQKVIITTENILGENSRIPTDFATLPRDVRVGQKILLDDGLLELRVDAIQNEEVHCTVIYGGILKDRKGMNVPGANLTVDCLTPKDLKDLEFGLEQKVEYVALSFVRRGDDIRRLRELIDKKHPFSRVIAKIEMLEAIDNLEDIIRLSDGAMVARGDLAVEVGQSTLPSIQKNLIRLCNYMGKPVITATQMLDSMVNNPRPTRAEITDVANAVLDGSDAVMLSAETASGKYPVKCVQTMHEIITEVEKQKSNYYRIDLDDDYLSVAEAIAASACLTALKLNASAIVCLTTTGKTAAQISAFRPKARIIAVTHLLPTLNRLELVWGIQTLAIHTYDSTDEAMKEIESLLLKYGLVKTGDKVVLTMGLPVSDKAKTNSLRVYTIQGESNKKLSKAELPLRYQLES